MQEPQAATRVRIYLSDSARWHGQPLVMVILERLRRSGAAGATAFRGIAGFGAHHRMHAATLEVLSVDLPVVVEWLDEPTRVERLLPGIAAMVTEGLITIESVHVVKYVARPLPRIAGDRTAADAMTRDVVTVHPETPIRELVESLLNHPYRGLPVVDGADHVVGIVTNGDLIERGGLRVRAELLPTLTAEALEGELRRLEESGKTAADIMTGDVVTARPETNLSAVAHLMAAQRLKRLPVVDAEGRVVGIISRVDVLRTLSKEGPAPEAAVTPAPVEGAATVGEVMSRRAPTIHVDAALADVLEAVVSTRLNRAVVVDDEQRPIGVISDAELMGRLDPSYHPSLAQSLMWRLPFVHPTLEEREEILSHEGTRAGDLMITPIVTVGESTPVVEAAQHMLERRLKILPVVNGNGHLVGLIDRADLLRAVAAG